MRSKFLIHTLTEKEIKTAIFDYMEKRTKMRPNRRGGVKFEKYQKGWAVPTTIANIKIYR